MRVSGIHFESGRGQPAGHGVKLLGVVMGRRIHIERIEPHPFPEFLVAERHVLQIRRRDREHSHDDLTRKSAFPGDPVDRPAERLQRMRKPFDGLTAEGLCPRPEQIFESGCAEIRLPVPFVNPVSQPSTGADHPGNLENGSLGVWSVLNHSDAVNEIERTWRKRQFID